MKLVYAIFFFFLFSIKCNAENIDACEKSTRGTDFWIAFMESRNYNRVHDLKLIVSATEKTSFTITYGTSQTPFNSDYKVEADSTLEVILPWQMFEVTGSEKIQNKGIHLISEKPVSVYAANWDPYSNDITVIYPVDMLGKTYFAMCYTPFVDPSNPESGGGRNSEFLLVATENNTEIRISPSKVTDQGVPENSEFEIILQKGEVYQVQSENIIYSDKNGQGDLTGSKVTASKPVAFFSGSLSTTVPYGSCCWDHLFEQIPPVQYWGKDYVTIPLKTRKADRYRILASNDKTSVFINKDSVIYLNEGDFREFEFANNQLGLISSDKPVLVAQFSQSLKVDSAFAGGNGDPFMIILNSTQQWTDKIIYKAYVSPEVNDDTTYLGIQRHFVNLLAPADKTGSITLDGIPLDDKFIRLRGNNFTFAQVETSSGTHTVESNGESSFQAYIYGFGKWESYGFSGGINTSLKLDLGESIQFFKKDTLLLCYGDTLKLNAGDFFSSVKWRTGETTPAISITSEGKYFVQAATDDGCILTDSVFVKVSYPQVKFESSSLVECEPFSIKLDGGEGYPKYNWENGSGEIISTNRFYAAKKTGEYQLKVIDRYRCEARDTFKLLVLPAPEIKIQGDSAICSQLTAKLGVSIIGESDSIWNLPGNFKWFSDDDKLSFSEIGRNSAQITASHYGDYKIYYQLKTIDSCVVTDTFKIGFYEMPNAEFEILDVPDCNQYNRELKFTGSASASSDFSWNLGGRQILDTLDWQHFIITVGAKTEKGNVSLTLNDKGCISKATQKLDASPGFILDSDYTRGCDSLTVNFSAEKLVTDSVEFQWNFNNQVSTQGQKVTQKFTKPGMYDVKLTMISVNSKCVNSFVIDSMISIFPTPVARFTANVEKCYPEKVWLVYSDQIDSSFCTWETGGNPVAGFDNDSFLMNIYHPFEKVKLTVSEFGCESKTLEKNLKRIPKFDFTVDKMEGCQPLSVQAIASTSDSQVEFFWLTDSVPIRGIRNSYNLIDTGLSDIGLIASSLQTGCRDTLIKPGLIQVHQKPFSKFEVNYPVALVDNAEILFANYAERADSYYWDFGDGQNSTEFSPVHKYTKVGDFYPVQIAETEFGCADTFSLKLSVVPSQSIVPNAFRPNSDIPENKIFMPVGPAVTENDFNLKIYSRSGEMVFESKSPFNPWEGKNLDGKEAPVGNYLWITTYTDIQGEKRTEKGQVILIR